MESLQEVLKSCAQLVEQGSLACPDRVSAVRWSLDHAQNCIRWRIQFVRMIVVEISPKVRVFSVTTIYQLATFIWGLSFDLTHLSRPIMVT